MTKSTPPKSVQAELDRVAASKRVPSLSKLSRTQRETDAVRIHAFVGLVLSEWKTANDIGLASARSGILKISMKETISVLSRSLKNTRTSRLRDIISDVLTGEDVCEEYGMWVLADFDSPDYLLIRLPESGTDVLRVKAKRMSQSSSYSISSKEEVLMDCSEEIEYEEIDNIDEGNNPDNWPLHVMQEFLHDNKTEIDPQLFNDAETLRKACRVILNK